MAKSKVHVKKLDFFDLTYQSLETRGRPDSFKFKIIIITLKMVENKTICQQKRKNFAKTYT